MCSFFYRVEMIYLVFQVTFIKHKCIDNFIKFFPLSTKIFSIFIISLLMWWSTVIKYIMFTYRLSWDKPKLIECINCFMMYSWFNLLIFYTWLWLVLVHNFSFFYCLVKSCASLMSEIKSVMSVFISMFKSEVYVCVYVY